MTQALGGILTDGPKRDLLKSRFAESLARLRALLAKSKNSDSVFAPPSHKTAALESQALDEVAVLLNTARELGDTNAVAAIERVLADVEAEQE